MEWAEYAALYPDGPDQGGFERLGWAARRIMEQAVTGVDGVQKLAAAPPTAPEAAQAVERCQAALIHQLWQAEQAAGCARRADGLVTGRVVTAVTAGNESVSYAAPAGAASWQESQEMLQRTVERYLAGVPDANGVNLLYMGAYPVKMG